MAEILSTPNDREIFEIGYSNESKESSEKSKDAEAKFYEAIKKLSALEQREKRRGSRLNVAEIGAEAGKTFVRYIASRQDDPKLIQGVCNEIRSLLPTQKAEEFISGFLTEYAVAFVLTEELGKEVYYSDDSRDEDTIQKIDWVVKEPDEDSEIYLQVKTLPLIEDPEQSQKLVFKIESQSDLRSMANNLYTYKYKGQPSVGHYMQKAEEMFKANSSNDAKLVFFFVPSEQINPYSGTFANKDFILNLDEAFSEI